MGEIKEQSLEFVNRENMLQYGHVSIILSVIQSVNNCKS